MLDKESRELLAKGLTQTIREAFAEQSLTKVAKSGLRKDYDPNAAFPYGLPAYDGSDDDDGGDEQLMPYPCANCGYSPPDSDATAKAADYREKAAKVSDPEMRRGYLALAREIEKGHHG